MKAYEAPKLYVDEYVADTMIASTSARDGEAANSEACWGCSSVLGQQSGNHICMYTPGTEAYENWC